MSDAYPHRWLPIRIAVGCFAVSSLASCANDDTSSTDTITTTTGGQITEEAPAYTIFVDAGAEIVGGRFEVSFNGWDDETGRFHISDNGEGNDFILGAGDSAEVSGWTFTITSFSGGTAQFTAISPDGETFPPQGS